MKKEYEYEYTQGPIFVSGKYEEGENRLFIGNKNSPMVLATMNPVHTQTPGNARRLAASWNRLLPFSTDEIEAGIDLTSVVQQRDTAWHELREIREAIKADENESTADEVRSLVKRLAALEEIATAVEADIDAGRPLEYNVDELRAELIRARKALGILPEQEQTTTLGMEEQEI